VGAVGRPRRRASIHADLKLLADLRNVPEIGTGTPAYQALLDHIAAETMKLAGSDTKAPRPPINKVAFGFDVVVFVGLAFLTYYLNRNKFEWYSIFSGLVAFGALGNIQEKLGGTTRSKAVTESADESTTPDV
jgi:hypothetical protein